MKITKTQLVKIIKEEVESVMYESWADMLSATKEIEADKNRAYALKKEKELIKTMPELMNADSKDPRSFIEWVQQYDPSDWSEEDTEKTKEILRNAPKLAKEMQKYIKNVIDFSNSGGDKGHQYTEEPWNARYMKTLQQWVSLDHKDLRNHLGYIMAEYIQDHLLGGIHSMLGAGYVDPEDAGLGAYGEED